MQYAEARNTMIKYAAPLLLACGLHAQSDSISINGTELRIGMPKSDVLASLAERGDLVKLKGIDDAWCVRFKDDLPRKSGCGNFIQFGRDKLVVVSRAMGSANGEDAAAMIAALYSTLDGLAKSGKNVLAFSTKEVEADDHIRLRIISFFGGTKKYTFTTQQPVGSQSASSSSVDLTESFALPSDRRE
ncbi:MAG: hypothetical protein ABSH32_09045 [Bryobacteraceae bacterium]|jgi:hypothetical protein